MVQNFGKSLVLHRTGLILVSSGLCWVQALPAISQYESQQLRDMLTGNGSQPLSGSMGTEKSYARGAQEDEQKGDVAKERGNLSGAADFYYDSVTQSVSDANCNGYPHAFLQRVQKLATVGAEPSGRRADWPGMWWYLTKGPIGQVAVTRDPQKAACLRKIIEDLFVGWKMQGGSGPASNQYTLDAAKQRLADALAERQKPEFSVEEYERQQVADPQSELLRQRNRQRQLEATRTAGSPGFGVYSTPQGQQQLIDSLRQQGIPVKPGSEIEIEIKP